MKAMLRQIAGRLYAYAYPTEGASITVTVNPDRPPGDTTWGWLSMHEPNDANGGLTVYLTRKQAFEVRDALNKSLSPYDIFGRTGRVDL